MAAAATAFSLRRSPAQARAPQYRAAIIGHAGQGDYGHGFDTVFNSHPRITVAALADPSEAGRAAAAKRARAGKSYADYREMLERERPDIVRIAPRHPAAHREAALAALAAGAHLLIEKPMTEHLEDADAIVDAAARAKRKVLVGHKNRFSRDFARMQRLLAEGFVGQVLEMRVQGKQDGRSGGEDLIVLGTHDFDAMRFFFGDPLWCFASVTDKGEPVERRHMRRRSTGAGDAQQDLGIVASHARLIHERTDFPQRRRAGRSAMLQGPKKCMAGLFMETRQRRRLS